ncbi:ATP-binding protein [Mucilaginibacter sp.]|uniref:ATP-binding protein n=1 Tax=Mucilaginibacter sp. TaxID=1882438 RepID=UPI00345D34C2
MFKRFWRASSAKSRNIAGIGLGLHVSKAIITQHGGKIWLKSEAGKAPYFTFTAGQPDLINFVLIKTGHFFVC